MSILQCICTGALCLAVSSILSGTSMAQQACPKLNFNLVNNSQYTLKINGSLKEVKPKSGDTIHVAAENYYKLPCSLVKLEVKKGSSFVPYYALLKAHQTGTVSITIPKGFHSSTSSHKDAQVLVSQFHKDAFILSDPKDFMHFVVQPNFMMG